VQLGLGADTGAGALGDLLDTDITLLPGFENLLGVSGSPVVAPAGGGGFNGVSDGDASVGSGDSNVAALDLGDPLAGLLGP
jgi:hypothetical protein